jgi:NAD(P)H-dependent FMN reductase
MTDRQEIRLADYLVGVFGAQGADDELIDAKALDLPMLDRVYKEYPKRSAPGILETLAEKIRTADAFVLVTGEYNWGVQPGLKNLTDHFLEAWFGRPGGYFQRFGEPTDGGGAALVKAIPGLC